MVIKSNTILSKSLYPVTDATRLAILRCAADILVIVFFERIVFSFKEFQPLVPTLVGGPYLQPQSLIIVNIMQE